MGEPIRVLVVDDDFMVARIHHRYVESTPGFTVVGEAHTFADALAAVEEHQPDLVLLDLYLPDVDVEELLSTMLGLEVGADVIVLSAANDAETVRTAFRGGAHGYLIKPFSREDLAARLGEYARRRSSVDRAVSSGGALEQGAVDAIFATGARHRESRALPKGLAQPTLELVVGALHEAARRQDEPTLSAAECGEAVGIARVSARRYLEHLVATGEARVEHRYGGSGRPERRYRVV